MPRKKRNSPPAGQTEDEKNTAKALKEQREQAIGNAVPRLLAIEREISARNGTKSAIYKSLDAKGVDTDAFKSAMKRCKKPQETLDLFDQETMGLETIIRKILEGNQDLEETEAEDDAASQATPSADQASAEDDPDQTSDPAAEPEDPDSEGGMVGGALETDEAPDDKPKSGVSAPANLAPADPAVAEKMKNAMANAGAEGISSDDLPMPETELHHNVIPLKGGKTGFVDRTPHLSAKEANEVLGTADDLLGTRH